MGSDDVDALPLAQYLMMDVLGARWRTGEKVWTFPTRCRSTARKLEELGLAHWKSGVVEKTILVWLTDSGKSKVLTSDYVPPILLDRKRDCKCRRFELGRGVTQLSVVGSKHSDTRCT